MNLIFSIVFSISAVAEPSALLSKGEKKFELYLERSIRIHCELNKVCKARSIAQNGTKLDKLFASWAGPNPASYVCKNLKGNPHTLLDMKKNEYAVCGFLDGSFFVTWDYIKSFRAPQK